MNSKAQSALEYLMTYGWALIVIAIVVGLLVYILSSTTTGGVMCSTTSTQFNLQQYAVKAGTDGGKFVVQNATGRSITVSSATGSGDFSGDGILDTNSVGKGQTFTISGIDTNAAGTTFTNGVVTVNYNAGSLTNLSFNIVCSGSV